MIVFNPFIEVKDDLGKGGIWKGNGNVTNDKYIVIYSTVEKDKRAQGGIGLLFTMNLKDNTINMKYVDEHIMKESLKLEKETRNIILIYAIYAKCLKR